MVNVTCLLALITTGCASGTTAKFVGTTDATVTESSQPTTTTRTPTATSGPPTTTLITTTQPSTTFVRSLPSLRLPAPDGDSAVGVASSGFPDTEVFYPSVAGTGTGHHRYMKAQWATAAGLDPAQMDRVDSSAQLDATPASASTPRPVVVLMPGWRSVIAFATSLAEELASHGYVVLAVQTDVATEASHESSTTDDRINRTALLRRVLDFVQGPSFTTLVGPIDLHRIAVGGHSYAGSTAFDSNLTDRRIAAIVDLDGSVRAAQTRTPPTRPALVLTTVNDATTFDPTLNDLAARSPNIVAVGITNALHADVTDAASIPSTLGTSVYPALLGAIGTTGTTNTSTIVLRFLDAALGTHARLPTTDQLLQGLASVTADPFELAAAPSTTPSTTPST